MHTITLTLTWQGSECVKPLIWWWCSCCSRKFWAWSLWMWLGCPGEYFWPGIFICHYGSQIFEAVDFLKLLTVHMNIGSDVIRADGHDFCFLSTYFHAIGCRCLVKLIYQLNKFVFFSCKASMSSVNCTLPPMLTVPSWFPRNYVMVLSRKVLKRVSESRHPWWTPTIIPNYSPKLLEKTAMVALLSTMTLIRFVLMLYMFLIVHITACHTLLNAFLKSTNTWYNSCWCWRHFSIKILSLNTVFVLLYSVLAWNLLAPQQWSSLPVASVCCGWLGPWPQL